MRGLKPLRQRRRASRPGRRPGAAPWVLDADESHVELQALGGRQEIDDIGRRCRFATGPTWLTSPPGAPSKKNETGTPRIVEICCSRLAPIRLVPFSYFWTCWKVRPRASPSFSWLMPMSTAAHPDPAADMLVDRIWRLLDHPTRSSEEFLFISVLTIFLAKEVGGTRGLSTSSDMFATTQTRRKQHCNMELCRNRFRSSLERAISAIKQRCAARA